jgi:hypothetical protein
MILNAYAEPNRAIITGEDVRQCFFQTYAEVEFMLAESALDGDWRVEMSNPL